MAVDPNMNLELPYAGAPKHRCAHIYINIHAHHTHENGRGGEGGKEERIDRS